MAAMLPRLLGQLAAMRSPPSGPPAGTAAGSASILLRNRRAAGFGAGYDLHAHQRPALTG